MSRRTERKRDLVKDESTLKKAIANQPKMTFADKVKQAGLVKQESRDNRDVYGLPGSPFVCYQAEDGHMTCAATDVCDYKDVD
jgi:hypothetical protein